MFIDFFYLLRARGLEISLDEWLCLIEALDKGLADNSLIEFYYLCRNVLVKTEADYDKFDLAFAEYFQGIQTVEDIPEELWNWLNQDELERDIMKAVMDSGDPLKKKMQMILGTQEEVDWTDMDAYNAADFKHPDYGFSPDGEFPLCNIEKGIIDSEMHFDIADTPEGDGWFLTSVDGGAIANAIPGKCIAVLTRFENGKFAETKALTTSGKSVHSCQPELGDNAIYKMAEHIEDMDVRDSMLKQILLMTKEKFGSIFGKEIGLYSKTEVIDGDFVHRNAFSVTMFKMEGKHVMLHINCRFAWGTESDEIVAKLTELAASYGGSLSAVEALPAVYVNSQRPFIKEFNDAYEEGSGFKAECVLAYGGSYAKAMPNIVSWGPIFPGEEDTCHEANEYIPIKSLLDNGRVFALALGRVALSDKLFK